MKATPNIDAAIRAGCTPWHEADCTYPACDCAPVIPDMIKTALRAAIPKEPSAEVIEAITDGLIAGHKIEVSGSGLEAAVTKHTREHRNIYRDFARAAYKALYRELWSA